MLGESWGKTSGNIPSQGLHANRLTPYAGKDVHLGSSPKNRREDHQ